MFGTAEKTVAIFVLDVSCGIWDGCQNEKGSWIYW
jgi:hypothetical protein